MEQTRRGFLLSTGRVLLVLPAGVSVVAWSEGCDSDGSGGTATCTGVNDVAESSTNFTITSSCAGEGPHNHTFVLLKSDLTSPPENGISEPTSAHEPDGHTHLVTISADDLAAIQSGDTVAKITSSTLGHTHIFQLRKSASAPVDASTPPPTTPNNPYGY